MTTRSHHLHDERLVDCWLAEAAGEPVDPPSAEHLADCSRCGTRYAALLQLFDAVRVEGAADSDAVFTPERLQAQQHEIARRLVHGGRAARVLRFPSPFAGRRMAGPRPRAAMRWIAAAAAAGLLAGVGAGMFLDNARDGGAADGQLASVRQAGTSSRPGRRLAPARAGAADNATTDDVFLSQLETALDRPYTRELAPLDALTPHVREVANAVR